MRLWLAACMVVSGIGETRSVRAASPIELKVSATQRTLNIGARIVDAKYAPLEEVFRSSFLCGEERAGASFAVYENGKLAAELWGGWADAEKRTPWKEDTISVLFSTTKSISSVMLAYVMDREGRSYSEKISSFWPEFGKHGKENITILQATLHQAGLPYTTANVSREDVADHRRMSKYFEDATPVWTPGEHAGYHALTFAFLLDQIVRRIDGQHRGINDILKQDFVGKYGIRDLSIGLASASDNERVATIRQLTDSEVEEEGRWNPEALRRYNLGYNAHNERLYETWPWITTEDYNVLENRLLPMPSNMGVGNARSLAELHDTVNRGVISPAFLSAHLSRPVLEDASDVVIRYPESKGYGFQFTKNPKSQWVFGHSGFGGQNVRIDTNNRLTYAYVTNALKIADAEQVAPWHKLVKKLYELH